MGFKQYPTLLEKGLAPLKDETWLTNGFLDNVIDWVPALKGIRLRDLPNNFITTDPAEASWIFCLEAIQRFGKGSAIVLHSFDALEREVLDALSSMFPLVYAISPLQLLLNQIPEHPLKAMGYSLWKEETEWLKWLNSKEPNSVVYVNFGSLAVLTPEQLVEFGWGLANSRLPFFWVIRPDLVVGKSAIFPPEFEAETKERGLIASWCPQEQVLEHSSVGGFLTHCGWNSTIESLCADGENFAVRPPFQVPFLEKASSLPPLPSPPLFSDRKPNKRQWQRREKPAKTADITGEVSGHRELRRRLEQVALLPF
ncbi:hypothetical protein L3X38_001131 [Prunus dulcis]|uniref:UDP-Glycosyltransferase superfamily protein n=1 Tax=Prunus dulcis TaxID=3755 RepID=A0AAD4WSZ4_PRUDU|nr:hypothetical protein L3X38_001131 [Prunus dulcis]